MFLNWSCSICGWTILSLEWLFCPVLHCSIVVVFIIQVLSYFFKSCMLILFVCACPVYHCVICVYAIRYSIIGSQFSNKYLLTYLLITDWSVTIHDSSLSSSSSQQCWLTVCVRGGYGDLVWQTDASLWPAVVVRASHPSPTRRWPDSPPLTAGSTSVTQTRRSVD